MKSQLDWNELFPRLPKKLRDDCLLEAVQLLSKEPVTRKHNGELSKAKGLRIWREHTDGHNLSAPGRSYTLNRKAVAQLRYRPDAGFGRVLLALLELKDPVFEFATIAKICERNKVRTDGTIAYLWSKSVIDIKR